MSINKRFKNIVVGSLYDTNKYGSIKILSYGSKSSYWVVEFINTGNIQECRSTHINTGSITDRALEKSTDPKLGETYKSLRYSDFTIMSTDGLKYNIRFTTGYVTTATKTSVLSGCVVDRSVLTKNAIKLDDVFETINYGNIKIIKVHKLNKYDVLFLNTNTVRLNVHNKSIRTRELRDPSLINPVEVGKVFTSNNYGDFKILSYSGKSQYEVKFINTGCITNADVGNIQAGVVLDHIANPKSKIGDIHHTYNYGDIKIIGIRGSYRDILFVNTGSIRRNVRQEKVGTGEIKDWSVSTVCNIGVSEPNASKLYPIAYGRWTGVLYRLTAVSKRKHYGTVAIDPCWLYFRNFNKWHIASNYVDGYELDKDLLSNHVVKTYGPKTCLYIPKRLNTTLGVYGSPEDYTLKTGTFKIDGYYLSVKNSTKLNNRLDAHIHYLEYVIADYEEWIVELHDDALITKGLLALIARYKVRISSLLE